jgi:hypothetical protein
MKSISKIITCFTFSFVAAHGAERASLLEFANVKYERGVLVITTTDSQAQYVARLGNKGVAGLLHANSNIDVPLGETSIFYERHLSLTLTPLAEGKGFTVERIANLRSLRRGVKVESFPLNIGPDGSVSFGDVTLKTESPQTVGKDGTPSKTSPPVVGPASVPATPVDGGVPPGTGTSAQEQQTMPSTAETGSVSDAAANAIKKPWILFAVAGLAVALILGVFLKKMSR